MLLAGGILRPLNHLKAVKKIIRGHFCQHSASFCAMWAACKAQEISLRTEHVFIVIQYNQYWNFLFLLTLRWWRWWLWWYVRLLFAGSPITSISWFTSSTRISLSIPSFSRSIWLSCGWQWAPLCTTPLSTAASMTGNFTWSENTVIDVHTHTHRHV